MSFCFSRFVAVTMVAAATSGCGGVLYAAEVNGASRKLAEAKEIGAQQLAPYEYTYADAHLAKAMSEASEGDYSDAKAFAEVAESYATKAIELSKEAHRGAGR
jgi:hypothetical protein